MIKISNLIIKRDFSRINAQLSKTYQELSPLFFPIQKVSDCSLNTFCFDFFGFGWVTGLSPEEQLNLGGYYDRRNSQP